MTTEANETSSETQALPENVDFDLHGIVGIRVRDALPGDVKTITRQIGPLRSTLSREPDIVVRFVDELPETKRMTYAGWRDCAGTEEDFYLLTGVEGKAARTLLPMADVGGRCEIVCERGAGRVPHLLAIINMTALAKGVLPLHASAFTHQGTGVLATGWAKGGKTETLLAFAALGADYVGDEWIYLTPDGGMYGVPEPIRLWHWHVAQLPRLRAELSRLTRTRLKALPSAATSARALGLSVPGLLGSVLRRAAPVVSRQAYVQVPPAQLFGDGAIALHGRLDHVLFVASHDRDDVTIKPTSGSDVAARMLASLEEERSPFLQVYRQFRFLFPHHRSPVVENASDTEGRLLAQFLGNRPAHMLRHPYPVRLETLVPPIESVLRADR